MKKNLLILMTLCISVLGYAQTVGDTFIDSNITYEITSLTPNNVKIIGYNVNGGLDVAIPAAVTPNSSGRTSNSSSNRLMNTYNVTRIGFQAFYDLDITSVTIPSSVTLIENYAFAINNLSEITIPDSVTSIGNQAFIGNDLTCAILGSGLQSIGGSTFSNNPALTYVNSKATTAPTIFTGNGDTFGSQRPNIDLFIPTGASAYNSYIGATWTGFNTFNSGLDVNDQFTVDNIRYRITSIVNSTVSVKSYNSSGAGGTVIDIPSTISACGSQTFTVNAIDINAFAYEPISSVTFPNTILTIGQNAFIGCNLTSVTIPANVNTVGQQAFQSNSISTLNISNGLTTIGDYAFSGNQLTDVTIPGSVTSIGNGAFRVNPLVTVTSEATLPPSITTVAGPNDTFDIGGIRSDIDLFIPIGTTGPYVTDPGALWTGFNSITEVLVVGDPLVSDYISYEVISTSSGRIQNAVEVTDYDVLGGTVVSIPPTITYNTIVYDVVSIRNQAFMSKGLTDVTIPDSVTNIGAQAFSANPLTDVRSLANTPPTITTGANDTFNLDRSTIHLHIPVGTTGAYVSDAGALWTGFNPVTEDALLSTNDFELANDIKIITKREGIQVISNNTINLQGYEIYTMAGARVSSGIESNISTNFLSSGIYILKLDFDKGTTIKKFIK